MIITYRKLNKFSINYPAGNIRSPSVYWIYQVLCWSIFLLYNVSNILLCSYYAVLMYFFLLISPFWTILQSSRASLESYPRLGGRGWSSPRPDWWPAVSDPPWRCWPADQSNSPPPHWPQSDQPHQRSRALRAAQWPERAGSIISVINKW